MSIETIYDGHVRVEVTAPTAEVAHPRVAIRSKEVVHVLPLTAEGQMLMIRQHRHPIGGEVLEFPAGGIDGDETPERAAHRELGEETGLRAGQMIPLGSFLTCPGLLDERAHLFLALDCVPDPDAPAPDEDERIDLDPLTPAQASARLLEGQDADAKSTLLLGLALPHIQAHFSGRG